MSSGESPQRPLAGREIDLVEDGSNPRLCCPHVGERTALVGGERIGAGELDQEQVVLHEVRAERRVRRRPAPNWRTK